MRYEPAKRLFQLAVRLTGSRTGLSIDEMAAELEVGRRTAERLRDQLGEVFSDKQLSCTIGEDRVRRWKLAREIIPALPTPPGTIATLESLAYEFSAKGDEARATDLRDAAWKLRAMMPPAALTRSEPDIEALMQAEGSAASPGPRLSIDIEQIKKIRHAILSFKKISVNYRAGGTERIRTRVLYPYGILYGRQLFIVAHMGNMEDMSLWRIDRLSEINILDEQFDRQDFDLNEYASQSLGVLHEPPTDIILHFNPEASSDAAEWLFHSSQTHEHQQDGSLIVKFCSGGLQELAWHLFTWGDSVNVIQPIELADMLPYHNTIYSKNTILEKIHMIEDNLLSNTAELCVKQYMIYSGRLQDNEISDTYLANSLMISLYERVTNFLFDTNIYYPDIIKRTFKRVYRFERERINECIGGYHAGLVVYPKSDESTFSQIVEFHIVDENRSINDISCKINQITQMHRLLPDHHWRGTILTILCPTEKRELNETIFDFKEFLNLYTNENNLIKPNFFISDPVLSNTKRWRWAVAIVNFSF
jgi:predicted DNA-binding transcriptional regulator YafY